MTVKTHHMHQRLHQLWDLLGPSLMHQRSLHQLQDFPGPCSQKPWDLALHTNRLALAPGRLGSNLAYQQANRCTKTLGPSVSYPRIQPIHQLTNTRFGILQALQWMNG